MPWAGPCENKFGCQTTITLPPGAYFVTICTHEKRRILSSIPVGALHEAPAVRLSGAGVIVRRIISCLPSRYPAAKDGAFNLTE